MAELLSQSREGGADSAARIYITCHPDDVAMLDLLRQKILKVADCTVYFTSDATDKQFDNLHTENLSRMNLIVFLVTESLLTKPSSAMENDLAIAKQEKIPILPIMAGEGLDEMYCRPEAFGERHYIKWNSGDLTEISFEDKLGVFISSVLVNAELTKKVRAAFDAYVFLSYRKKDRAYANKLLRLIHSNPVCRDVAVWYDEFLTPGESFNENISKMLRESSLFTLLITPQILESTENGPNFVVAKEYPAAIEAGLHVLPAEMAKTDKDELRRAFLGLPECVDTDDTDEFFRRFTEHLTRLAKKENDGDIEHNFLIGLAYLEGIDVEIDRERGVSLITASAEAGLHEAMEKLYYMYYNGHGVKQDYDKGLFWCEKAYERAHELYGEDEPGAINATFALADAYAAYGSYAKAKEYHEKAYASRLRTLGEEHADTIKSMEELAPIYHYLKMYNEELHILDKRWEICERVYGCDHPQNLAAVYDMATGYDRLSQIDEENKKIFLPEAVKLYESLYNTLRGVGMSSVGTVGWLSLFLSSAYGRLGNEEKSREYSDASLASIIDPDKKDKNGNPMDEIDQLKEILGFDFDDDEPEDDGDCDSE